MNYQLVYNNLVQKAKSEHRKKLDRANKDYVYYERHHIIPICLGGNSKKENLVLLTAREHFIAHKLLVEIYPENNKLMYALSLMMYTKNTYQDRDYLIGSKEYERFRIIYADTISKDKKGKSWFTHTEESRENSRIRMTGRVVSQETRDKLRESHKVENLSLETRAKMSKSQSEKKLTEEHKLNIGKGVSGEKNGMYGKGYLLEGEKNGRYKKPVLQETRDKISISKKGVTPNISEETRKKYSDNFSGENNPMYDVHRFGKDNPFFECKHSKESLDIISEKAKNRERVTCPHCGLTLDISNAKRWHFDNCKHKD